MELRREQVGWTGTGRRPPSQGAPVISEAGLVHPNVPSVLLPEWNQASCAVSTARGQRLLSEQNLPEGPHQHLDPAQPTISGGVKGRATLGEMRGEGTH